MPVIIVGMHRSGTSLLAGLMKIAGCSLGPESSFIAATDDNPTGFFENSSFLEFNDRILKHFGGTWYDPPDLSAGWLDDDQVRLWAEDARRAVAEQFGNDGQWAWKEPRTSVLLPFWRSVVPKAKVVLCLRNPLDVAGSLAKRNGFILEHSLALWHIYTLLAVVDTDPADLAIVSYDSLLRDYRTKLGTVFEFAGMEMTTSSEAWAEIDAFVSGDLEHHHHSVDDLYQSPRVMCATKDLFRDLCADDTEALARHIEESARILPVCRQITSTMRDYYEVKTKYDLAAEILNTRPHRLASRFSEWANRAPGVADILRKFWR